MPLHKRFCATFVKYIYQWFTKAKQKFKTWLLNTQSGLKHCETWILGVTSIYVLALYMSKVKSGSLMQKRYHIGPSSHFNFKRLFKDCSHVLSKCWAQSPCSLFKSGESRLRSRLLGNAEEEWAPVWVVWLQRDWKHELGLLHTYTGGRPSCALYLHCTSTARCMETRAKNTL